VGGAAGRPRRGAGALNEALARLAAVDWPSRRTLLVIGSAVLLVVVLGGAGWFWYASQQRQSQAVYAEAMARAQAATGAQATPEARTAAIGSLEAALERYPSGAGAAQAAYQLGNLRYAAQQYPGSRAAYEIALARGATGTIATLARVGVAYTWEAERQFDKAVDAYRAAAAGLKPGDFAYEETLMDLARAQELAGKKDDAVTTYRQLLKDVPQGRRVEDVRARLAALGASATP
jgi:tetratricopeptide (TPR) repeat protein